MVLAVRSSSFVFVLGNSYFGKRAGIIQLKNLVLLGVQLNVFSNADKRSGLLS